MQRPDARLFLDVTGIREYIRNKDTVSGVQRVILELIRQCRSHGFRDVYACYFDKKLSEYCAVPLISEVELKDIGVGELRAIFWPDDRFDAKYNLKKYRKKPGKYRWAMLRARITGRAGHRPSQVNVDLLRRDIYRPKSVRDLMGEGDVCLMMDGHIDLPGAKEAFTALANGGVRIVQFIHDLIPYRQTHFYFDDHAVNFSRWLCDTTAYVSHYICNSGHTKAEIDLFLAEQKVAISSEVVQLAREKIQPRGMIAQQSGPHLGIGGPVRGLLAHEFVLCVGTREIRKNNWRLLTAWSRLEKVAKHDMPKLVFAGRKGWLNDDFDEFLEYTGNLQGQVVVIDGPSDIELDFLYRRCLFTAYVSMSEGWGLPIGEALAYGKAGVYSRLPPMQEAGLTSGRYCDPFSICSITDALQEMLASPQLRGDLERNARETAPRSWRDVAVEIFLILREGTAKPEPGAKA